MSVYVIALLKFTDTDAYRRYQAAFPPVFARFRAKLLVADEAPQVMEGAWSGDKVVVMEFPDVNEALRFAGDAEYEAISRDRRAGTDAVVVLAHGFEPPGQ